MTLSLRVNSRFTWARIVRQHTHTHTMTRARRVVIAAGVTHQAQDECFEEQACDSRSLAANANAEKLIWKVRQTHFREQRSSLTLSLTPTCALRKV